MTNEIYIFNNLPLHVQLIQFWI